MAAVRKKKLRVYSLLSVRSEMYCIDECVRNDYQV